MTKEQKLALMKNRYNVLSNREEKNVKAPGVLCKLARQIRAMEREQCK